MKAIWIHRLTATIFLFLLSVPLACGASYSIEISGPTTVATNTNFSIDIYLTETLSVGETTVLGNNDPIAGGLVTGNWKVEVVNGSSSLTRLAGNTAFDTYNGDVTEPVWTVEQSDLEILNGTPTGTLSDGKYRLRLGTITGMSSSIAETFQWRIIDPFIDGQEDMVLADFMVLDSQVFSSTTYSLTISGAPPIPEPSMCVMFAAVLLTPFARSIRGRRGSGRDSMPC